LATFFEAADIDALRVVNLLATGDSTIFCAAMVNAIHYRRASSAARLLSKECAQNSVSSRDPTRRHRRLSSLAGRLRGQSACWPPSDIATLPFFTNIVASEPF
jgi:hypothetical protein